MDSSMIIMPSNMERIAVEFNNPSKPNELKNQIFTENIEEYNGEFLEELHSLPSSENQRIRFATNSTGFLPYKCKYCNYLTCYPESLVKHCRKQHQIRELNSKDFYNSLKDVEMMQTGPQKEIIYKCLECRFETDAKDIIYQHIAREHNITDEGGLAFVTKYNCPKCGHVFDSQRSMRIHFTLAHKFWPENRKSLETVYNCSFCGKEFSLKSSLVLHKRSCNQTMGIECCLCQEKVFTLRKFELHLIGQHGVHIKHKCTVCGKSFNNAKCLILHCRRHSERSRTKPPIEM